MNDEKRKGSLNENEPLLKEPEDLTKRPEKIEEDQEEELNENTYLKEYELQYKLGDELLKIDLEKIRDLLFVKMEPGIIQIIFFWSILKGSWLLAQELYNKHKKVMMEILSSDIEPDFNDELKDQLKNSKTTIIYIIDICFKHHFEGLSSDILSNCNIMPFTNELVKKAILTKNFNVYNKMSKKMKNYFRTILSQKHLKRKNRNSNIREFSKAIENHLKDLTKKENDNKKLTLKEREQEMIEVNKLLIVAIQEKQEKSSIKLLKYYYLHFRKDFIVQETINQAVRNDLYLFVKKYFDIFPFSFMRITDLMTIAKIMELLDEKDTFVHGVFLMEKIESLKLTEIHVRLIIEKFELIWKEKLYYFTYCVNPILVSVCICEFCLRLSKIFINVHVKLEQVSMNFLQLATIIKNEIHDEIFIKHIYLKKAYPSTNRSLLQILTTNNDFYSSLLSSRIVQDIISELWISQNFYTPNIFITSSSYQNLRGKLLIYENHNYSLGTQNSMSPGMGKLNSLNSTNKVADAFDNIINYQLIASVIDENALKLSQLQNIDLKNPFHFIRKSNFYDIRSTNHVFTYFFWKKSPAYKVLLEAIVYIIFFAIIAENLLAISRIRRIFLSFSLDILTLIDGFVGLLYGYPVTAGLIKSVMPWMKANNVTDPKIAFFYASKQTTRCGVMLMFVPSFINQCADYEYAAINIWSLSDKFFILQYFFYFTFVGSVFEFIYVIILYKKLKFSLKLVLDLVITVANIWVQDIYYTRVYQKKAIVRDDLLSAFLEIESFMIFFTFLMWLKFFVYLKLTKTFGYVIKIIEIMIKELLNFFIVFFVVVLAFALLTYDVLGEAHYKFSTFEISVRTLLEISYGQIFFDGFESNETLAAVIISIFSVITMIILLNLLVAILSNTYNTINVRSNLENSKILYENYLMRKPDKYHSSLISFPPPLNIFIILLAPFIIFNKNSVFNDKISKYGFFLYSIIYSIIYIVFGLIFVIPICWLKYILSIFLNVTLRKKTCKSVILLLLWLFFGIPKLIYLFFGNDFPLFIKSIYYTSLNRDRLDEITLEEIKLIIEIANNLLEINEFTTHREFCAAIRDKLNNLNKKARKQSLMTDPSYGGMNVGVVSKKVMINKIFGLYSSQTSNLNDSNKDRERVGSFIGKNPLNKNVEKRLLQDVEIDKMEVFSLIRQFVGVDGFIMLKRMIQLLQMMVFCKKFSLDRMNRKQRESLVNSIQIVDINAVEKAVLGILSETLKSNEMFGEVMKNLETKKKEELEKEKEEEIKAKAEISFGINDSVNNDMKDFASFKSLDEKK